MKNFFVIWMALFGMSMPCRTSAQSQEMQQLLLNIEKLSQFKQILLDMKKGYDVLNEGYDAVKELSQGNFNLHKTFIDGLLQVSPAVKKYKKIADIVNYQLILVNEYKLYFNQFASSSQFNEQEIRYIEKVYATLFKQSLRNLDELASVITANTLRMSDDERLESIDRICADMQDKLVFLRNFNGTTALLTLQRSKEYHDVNSLRKIYKFSK